MYADAKSSQQEAWLFVPKCAKINTFIAVIPNKIGDSMSKS
jgi:hypothetical protein